MVSLPLEWGCLDPVGESTSLADPVYADSQDASVPLSFLLVPDACPGHSPTWHLTLTTSTGELRPSLPRRAPSASQEAVSPSVRWLKLQSPLSLPLSLPLALSIPFLPSPFADPANASFRIANDTCSPVLER